MKIDYREEFTTPCSPENMKVVRVTGDESESHAIYLDKASWTPDSRTFVFLRQPDEKSGRPAGYWICDTEDDFAIRPLCEFDKGLSPSSPDDGQSYDAVFSPLGEALYELTRKADQVEIVRIDVASGERRAVATAPLPLLSRGHHTLSADGQRLCMGNFLGDGKTEGAPWGAYIFELESGEHRVVEFGNGYRNMHCAYRPDPDPEHSHDLMLSATPPTLSDGSFLTPPDGSWRHENMPPDDGKGGAIVFVRDDGTHWRMLPTGRDPQMSNCHHVWRGKSGKVVVQTYWRFDGRWRSPLLEAEPVPIRNEEELWLGIHHPDGSWIDLSRNLPRADSCHFGFDASGRHLISDTDGYNTAAYSLVFCGTYVETTDGDPFLRARYLALPRTSWKGQPAHPHPYLSPDGRFGVIQSDFFGVPQVYVIFGHEYP